MWGTFSCRAPSFVLNGETTNRACLPPSSARRATVSTNASSWQLSQPSFAHSVYSCLMRVMGFCSAGGFIPNKPRLHLSCLDGASVSMHAMAVYGTTVPQCVAMYSVPACLSFRALLGCVHTMMGSYQYSTLKHGKQWDQAMPANTNQDPGQRLPWAACSHTHRSKWAPWVATHVRMHLWSALLATSIAPQHDANQQPIYSKRPLVVEFMLCLHKNNLPLVGVAATARHAPPLYASTAVAASPQWTAPLFHSHSMHGSPPHHQCTSLARPGLQVAGFNSRALCASQALGWELTHP